MKLNFKEIMRSDIRTAFMNPEEFGEEHTVGQKKMLCMVDNNEMIDREKRLKQENRNGVFKAQKLIYVAAKDFGRLPAPGRIIVFDGSSYMITDAINEDGIYSISMEANQS